MNTTARKADSPDPPPQSPEIELEPTEQQESVEHCGRNAGESRDTAKSERLADDKAKQADIVQIASEESFPASDPPAWTLGR